MMFWSISVVSEYLSLPSALCAIGKQLLIHNLNHIDRKNILYLVQYHDLRWIRIEKFLDSQMLIFSREATLGLALSVRSFVRPSVCHTSSSVKIKRQNQASSSSVKIKRQNQASKSSIKI